MKLTIALASPHGTRRRGSACSPFGEHRALAAYPRCSTDAWRLDAGHRALSLLSGMKLLAVALAGLLFGGCAHFISRDLMFGVTVVVRDASGNPLSEATVALEV